MWAGGWTGGYVGCLKRKNGNLVQLQPDIELL